MTRLGAFWERMRGTYWAVPSVMVAVSVIFSIVMVDVDRRTTAQFVRDLSWVFTGGPEGARAVLSTIASSMITVAGVTFSITIVALTLASQQFGPRLLRNFLRDLGNQVTLGTFVSTFTYCLLVLRTVRGTDDERFVPHLAVTVGVVLAMLSLGVLIFFIHHIATSIQASQVIANVAADLDRGIDRLFPEQMGRGPEMGASAQAADIPSSTFAGAHAIVAAGCGYIQAVDSAALLTLATKFDAVLRVDSRPGTFVRSGTPLVSVARPFTSTNEVDEAVRATFIIGAERTGTQDIGFYVDQLVELAVRALSPGINDPATASACIDRLEQALYHLAGRKMPSASRHDADGRLRVVERAVTFVGMLDLAFTEIARYGRSSVSVSCRLLDALRDLAPCVTDEEGRLALVRQVIFVGDRSADPFDHEMDRAELAGRYRAAMSALDT